eukprot:15359729-Ditylum_brightwellii.AAC.1
MELVPHTGRTHQLRVHCACIGHPIVGDDIYGVDGDGSMYGGFDFEGVDGGGGDNNNKVEDVFPCSMSLKMQRELDTFIRDGEEKGMGGLLCLHAKELSIYHPYTGAPMTFTSKAPF